MSFILLPEVTFGEWKIPYVLQSMPVPQCFC